MPTNDHDRTAARGKAFWAGWVLTALPALMLLFGAVNSILLTNNARDGLTEMGYPESTARPIGVVLLLCTVLYLYPRTAVLGAILLTGYLGGAVATHVRIEDPIVLGMVPVIVGVFVWLGLYLRDPQIRSIVPWRR
ncbi:MAG: DoxX family protein [Phycisphaerales bacterium]|nr:DoxX family protein [Planctomycetota bacterium]MCH8507671.1 DoxX family protein [Phycisphaerales bacterium]